MLLEIGLLCGQNLFMEALSNVLLIIHIIIGSLSLIVFWIPIFVKKGSKLHVKAGEVYVFLMWIVIVTAIFLCILNIFKGKIILAAFLGYLSVITAQPLWYGIAIVKHRRQIPDNIRVLKIILNWILFLGGVGLTVWSLVLHLKGQTILLLIFGLLGLSSSVPFLFSKNKRQTNWLQEHIEGMVGTGIAAYTAFIAFGGTSLFGHIFKGPLVAIPWVLPTVIGTLLIRTMKSKWSYKNPKEVKIK